MQLQKENAPATRVGDLTDASGAVAAVAMGMLLADMNHDIRTSMNGVRGMLELLLDTGLTPSQQQYARTAQYSVDNLLESLERIVDMSLIESNQFRLNEAPFDLRREMQQAWATREASARARGIELSIAYPPAVLLRGDAARLRTAVSSLVDIALQGAGHGKVTVTMNAASTFEGRCDIDLSVHAPGLSAAGMRLASALAAVPDDQAAGLPSGGKDVLGAALCARLAQLMGGSIDVATLSPQGAMLRLSVSAPVAASFSGIRGIAVCGNTDEWKPHLSLLARHGVDVFDSVAPALAAIEAAAGTPAPYRIVMIGRQVQGMDAAVVASAVKAHPAYRTAQFALLDDKPAMNRESPAGDGFAIRLCSSSDPSAIESALMHLWSAAAHFSSDDAVPSADKDAAQPLFFPGKRILVADDNPVNQQVAARMIEKLGCKVELAADGVQAVAMHSAHPFDLILMDCEMPVLDGLQATRCIRNAEDAGQRTPVIALTACTGQGEQEQCLAAGMDDFLSKPIRPQMLKDTLARWLSGAAVETGIPTPAFDDELESVQEMFGADFSELAALYQNDGAPRLTAIRDAYAQGDLVRVAKVAHAFSGSSASIGATGLSALGKEMETSAKAGSLDDFERRMKVIEAEYQRICRKLQSLLKP